MDKIIQLVSNNDCLYALTENNQVYMKTVDGWLKLNMQVEEENINDNRNNS
jgi:glycerol kinase